MAVNLVKHKDELLSAWKEVVDDKVETNWALFGYDKQSYDLCVVGKGAGGLGELTEELNCGKIMYAFCKVQDPSASLSKFVLINWQGEGAPLVKKGCCANHLMDISNFFRGAHITVTARNEDDVEPSLILEKLSKCTVSSFSLRERSDPTESARPIEEEKKRIEEEKLKAEAARSYLAEQVKERELKEAQAREEWFKERSLFY
uniref:ADF-H domain-containing protein n=1 Tax=Amblyomma triste TaxID=251400 RepID=A0A023GFW9_AMBTT